VALLAQHILQSRYLMIITLSPYCCKKLKLHELQCMKPVQGHAAYWQMEGRICWMKAWLSVTNT